MLERLVKVETVLATMPAQVAEIDKRLRSVERHIWAGIGGLATLQVILTIWS